MPAVGGSAGSYGRLIVTPDMVPPDAAHWDDQEQVYRSGATVWDGIHQQIVVDQAAFFVLLPIGSSADPAERPLGGGSRRPVSRR